MRVLLVATNRVDTPFPVYPIGVDYVATALRDRHDVQVLDLACAGSEAALLAAFRDFAPDVIGLSIRNVGGVDLSGREGSIVEFEQIVALLRQNSTARLILGGPGFSIFPQVLMKRLGADYGIAGEGERLCEFLDGLALGKEDSVPGLLIGDRWQERPSPWMGPRLRQLSSPQTVAHYVASGGMLNVQTKRGCPYLCTYCAYPGIEGRKLRLSQPEAVAREWHALILAGAKFLFVADAVFNSHVGHNLAVADALQHNPTSVPWGAFFAPLKPPRDYYRRLREAGLTHAEFGTESLSQAMLKQYRKPFTVEHALAAHTDARAAGIHVAHYFMLGGPGETEATVRETLDHCDRLDDAALFFFCGVRISPGTAVHAQAVREGQIDADDDLLAPRIYAPAAISLDAIRDMVAKRARGRRHWVIGAGDTEMAAVVKRMHQRGHVGPLWDRLVMT